MRQLPLMNRIPMPYLAPGTWVTVYYLLLASLTAGVLELFPSLWFAFRGERLATMAREGTTLSFVGTDPVATGQWLSWDFAAGLGLSMVGAFVLMMPVTWVYAAVRRRRGMDQTVVQTVVILALTVAGVVVVVRNSLALAFSLAAIVSAVRFRNALKDSEDTLYIFLAIGVGFTAGVEALAAAFVLSAVFNYLVLLLWRVDYGHCDLGHQATYKLLTAPTPPATEVKAERPFNAVLRVRARSADVVIGKLEPLLTTEAKRWVLSETRKGKGEVLLTYLLRLRKRAQPEDIEGALLAVGGDDVIGARINWRAT